MSKTGSFVYYRQDIIYMIRFRILSPRYHRVHIFFRTLSYDIGQSLTASLQYSSIEAKNRNPNDIPTRFPEGENLSHIIPENFWNASPNYSEFGEL